MSQFIILTLPRSRSAWMAWYLSYLPAQVGHDLLIQCDTVADFGWLLGQVTGTVETGAMMGWRLIRARLPEAKLITVHRPLDQIHDSFKRLGLVLVPGELEVRAEMLAQLAEQPGVESIPFAALDDPLCAQWLFEHCLETEWDRDWWLKARGVNIQIDMGARLQWLGQRQPQLAALKAEVQAETRRLMI